MSRIKSLGESTPDDIVQPLLTYQEVAEILGVTDRTVWEFVRKGELLNVKIGRSVRIDPADLRQFIQDSKSK